MLCVPMRLYNFLGILLYTNIFFPQENKYAIYIKVNGHLEMTIKVPYINGGKNKIKSKETPKKAHHSEESTSHYFTWVATQTVKM